MYWSAFSSSSSVALRGVFVLVCFLLALCCFSSWLVVANFLLWYGSAWTSVVVFSARVVFVVSSPWVVECGVKTKAPCQDADWHVSVSRRACSSFHSCTVCQTAHSPQRCGFASLHDSSVDCTQSFGTVVDGWTSKWCAKPGTSRCRLIFAPLSRVSLSLSGFSVLSMKIWKRGISLSQCLWCVSYPSCFWIHLSSHERSSGISPVGLLCHVFAMSQCLREAVPFWFCSESQASVSC